MKKLFVILVSVAMLAGCYVPSGYYRVTQVRVYSTHGGEWHEVSPGHYRPPRNKVVVIEKRKRRDRRSARARRHRNHRNHHGHHNHSRRHGHRSFY